MSNHTPGPWQVRKRGDVVNAMTINLYGGKSYRSHVAYIGGYTVSEMQANARLIAAAPEMYALLDHFRTNVSGGSDLEVDQFDKAVRELLAKVHS